MSLDSESLSSVTSNLLVAVRIRPLSAQELASGHKSCCEVFGKSVVAIRRNGDASQYLKSQQLSINEYAFDAVFDEAIDQMEVYEKTAKSFIPRLIEGENVTVFAYGATGAGKTHTMLGNTRADSAAGRAEAGIIPNSVSDLFQLLGGMKKSLKFGESYQLQLSFLEVYNEQVYDLLEPSGKVLAVREDQERGIVVVAGITEQLVENYDQVIDFIMQGNRRRKTESTMANAVSSRSHAVLQLTLKHTTRNSSGREAVVESKLSLIDLAGSERASATDNRGIRLQEGASINKSLLALANCINSLSEKASSAGGKRQNVKYRDSKLTHLLKSSLEGNCNLVMIANINPSDVTYEDSHNTLKYANRAKCIKVNPLVKEASKDSTWMEREHRLREENVFLKRTVEKMREQLVKLQTFRDLVVENDGMIPADYDLAGIADSPDLDACWSMIDSFSAPSSSAGSVAGSCCSLTSSSMEDAMPPTSKLLLTEKAAAVSKSMPSFEAPQLPMKVQPMTATTLAAATISEDVLSNPLGSDETPTNPRKRRASHLPTIVISSRIAKRRSLAVSDTSASAGGLKFFEPPPSVAVISKAEPFVPFPQHSLPPALTQPEDIPSFAPPIEPEQQVTEPAVEVERVMEEPAMIVADSVPAAAIEKEEIVVNSVERTELEAQSESEPMPESEPADDAQQPLVPTQSAFEPELPVAEEFNINMDWLEDAAVAPVNVEYKMPTMTSRRASASHMRKNSMAKVTEMLNLLSQDVSTMIPNSGTARVTRSRVSMAAASLPTAPLIAAVAASSSAVSADNGGRRQTRSTQQLNAMAAQEHRVQAQPLQPAAFSVATRRRSMHVTTAAHQLSENVVHSENKPASTSTSATASITTRRKSMIGRLAVVNENQENISSTRSHSRSAMLDI